MKIFLFLNHTFFAITVLTERNRRGRQIWLISATTTYFLLLLYDLFFGSRSLVLESLRACIKGLRIAEIAKYTVNRLKRQVTARFSHVANRARTI